MIGDFLSRTTPRSFSIPLIYVIFAVTLANLWILTTLLVSIVLKHDSGRPVFTGPVFRRLLLQRWDPDRPATG